MLSRRKFLGFAAAGAAGLFLPKEVAAEPERRIFALDRTMIPGPNVLYSTWWDSSAAFPDYDFISINDHRYPVSTWDALEGSQSIVTFERYDQVNLGQGRVFINGEEIPTPAVNAYRESMRGMWPINMGDNS